MYRDQTQEGDQIVKTRSVNPKTISDNKKLSYQQYSLENITKSSSSIMSKNKNNINGGSDPRFKRHVFSHDNV